MEFRLGSIPVNVRGQFLLTALLLGMNELDPARLAAWVAVVFVSVIVHEMGHALTGKAFGQTPAIVLHGMGGLTMFAEGGRGLGRWRSIAISFAGPLAGFLFGGVVLVALGRVAPSHPLVSLVLVPLVQVNIGWGVFNLLPMLPLDGGNIMRALVKRETIARVVSIAFAVGIGLLALRARAWWGMFLAVVFTFQNVQALRSSKQRRIDEDLIDAIRSGQAALEQQAFKTAIEQLGPALDVADASPELRREGLRLYLIALLNDGQLPSVVSVIEREHRTIGPLELAQYARALRDLGHEAEATQIDTLRNAAPALSEFRT